MFFYSIEFYELKKRLLLFEQLEGSLLGDIARLLQLLERLEARGVLLLGHDAALASLH